MLWSSGQQYPCNAVTGTDGVWNMTLGLPSTLSRWTSLPAYSRGLRCRAFQHNRGIRWVYSYSSTSPDIMKAFRCCWPLGKRVTGCSIVSRQAAFACAGPRPRHGVLTLSRTARLVAWCSVAILAWLTYERGCTLTPAALRERRRPLF